MKKLALLIALLLIPCRAWATDYCADENAVGCWLFREGEGETVDDSTANSNTGTFKGSGEPAWAAMSGTNAPKYSSYMVDFDGSNDYISASNASLQVTRLTIIFWVMGDSAPETSVNHVVKKFSSSSDSENFSFSWGHANASFRQTCTVYTNSWYPAKLTTSLQANTWYSVACTYDGDAVRAYLGGTLETTNTAPNGNPVTGDNVLAFGVGGAASGSLAGYFNGKMSEVALFSRVLSLTEIDDIMDNGLSPASGPSIHTTIIRNAVIRNAVIR